MRSDLLIAWACIFAVGMAGCSKPGNQSPPTSRGYVNLFIYSEYLDKQQLPADFQKRTGYELRISEYEATEELIAKLRQAGGANQYDVIVATDFAIPMLIKLGLISPLDYSQIPNAKNVADRFRSPPCDPGGQYTLPYQWGTVGLFYRKDRIPRLEPSWATIFEPDLQPGPFVLIDSMRDMLACALKYQGHSINTRKPRELRSAGELILRAKKSPKMIGFEGGVGGKNKVASGDASLAIVYNGDAIRAIHENPDLAFVLPREGSIIWVDVMTVSTHAPNVAGAHAFIDYILDAEVGASLANYNRYATPNRASLPKINPDDLKNPAIYPTEAQMKTLEYLEDVGSDTRLYDEVWTAVKSR